MYTDTATLTGIDTDKQTLRHIGVYRCVINGLRLTRNKEKGNLGDTPVGHGEGWGAYEREGFDNHAGVAHYHIIQCNRPQYVYNVNGRLG
jgi:hypothetical protein